MKRYLSSFSVFWAALMVFAGNAMAAMDFSTLTYDKAPFEGMTVFMVGFGVFVTICGVIISFAFRRR